MKSIKLRFLQVRNQRAWKKTVKFKNAFLNIFTLKTSVLLLHVNHDSNFLGIWNVYF